jgi:membrane protein YdbS with pleckstrin-like domain
LGLDYTGHDDQQLKKDGSSFMTTENPINLRHKSFASFDDALALCELLKRETGDEYTVISDHHLGFTANRRRAKSHNPQLKNAEAYEDDSKYRQALRGFIPHYLEIAVGALLLINPYIVIGWVFSLLNIRTIPEWIHLEGWGVAFGLAGFLLFLCGLRCIYSYFAVKMCFDEDGVILKKGIIAQTQVQIRFGDIKTIGVQQSILDRVLGIGTLHLDSAGTNGTVDIIFENLVNPVYMRRRIQWLIDQYTKNRG